MSERKLHIAPGLSLPLSAVTETFAVLAKRGMGKTYTAAVMAEEMLKVGAQIVVCDPVGVWWGLRSGSDGKSPGLPIIVMGGEHGDIPLDETTGAIVAEFIVDTGSSVVLDLGLLRKGAMIRFMTDFAEKLYHAKAPEAKRSPLHMFLDEADAFAPQKPQPDQARLLGAMQDLVRRGRARGVGITMITQRSAVLNKDVLTQAEVLVPLRTISPQDRKAIEEWIDIHADKSEANTVLDSLPSLPKGTAWFWSPGWLDICQKVNVRKRETFDSSATPEFGKSYKNIQLAPVDLDALKTKMAATIEKAKADDPRELRAEIARLKRELSAGFGKPRVEEKIKIVERRIEVVPKEVKKEFDRLQEKLRLVQGHVELLTQAMGRLPDTAAEHRASTPITVSHVTRSIYPPSVMKHIAPNCDGAGKLRAGAERMLSALVQWSPEGMAIGQMRSHAGMKKSGTFTTYMSDLRKGVYIDERDGKVYATEEGLKYFGGNVPSAPTTTEEVLSIWEPKLRDGARRILRVLVDAGGDPVSMEDLTAKANLAKSGTFTTYLSDLRTARLITTERGQASANRETLFL